MERVVYSDILSHLQTEQWKAVIASDKESTTNALQSIFNVAAVLGLAIDGDEPAESDPRFAAEWKLDKLHEQHAQEPYFLRFSSDVSFSLHGVNHFKDTRISGILSNKERQLLLDSFVVILGDESVEAESQKNKLRAAIVEDAFLRGQQIAYWQREYSQPFEARWEGAYVVQMPDGVIKTTQVFVTAEFATGIDPDTIAKKYNPSINAGIPLVELGQELGVTFIATQGEQSVQISCDDAYRLVVEKVLPEHYLQQLLEKDGLQIQPLIESEIFSNYWMLQFELAALPEGIY